MSFTAAEANCGKFQSELQDWARRPEFSSFRPRRCGSTGESACSPPLAASQSQVVILFDDRESAKNLATMEKLWRSLARAGADRRSIIIGVGGGVVGDIAGFVAATYLRGVRLVHVPTTLVAQVDSAIGGKTGVDLPEGKNLVGAFYQPDMVIADAEVLRTLPDREYRSGLYEIIKYGVIGDRALFAQLEQEMSKLLRRDHTALGAIIPRCIAAKSRIVSLDERESGLRETLNFGHTIGHALESITKYRVFLHGEAVAWGMIAATLLSVAAAKLPLVDAARIIGLVRRVGHTPPLPAGFCDTDSRRHALRQEITRRSTEICTRKTNWQRANWQRTARGTDRGSLARAFQPQGYS